MHSRGEKEKRQRKRRKEKENISAKRVYTLVQEVTSIFLNFWFYF